MPAVSVKQRRAMAIAKNHPEKLHAANRGLLRMSDEQLDEFASTPEGDLPVRKTARKSRRKSHWSDRIG